MAAGAFADHGYYNTWQNVQQSGTASPDTSSSTGSHWINLNDGSVWPPVVVWKDTYWLTPTIEDASTGAQIVFSEETSLASAESLTNPNLTSGTSWTATPGGDCALAANAATCTYSAGAAAEIYQNSVDMAIPPAENARYKFVYTVSGVSGSPTARIAYALDANMTALDLTAGTHTLYFTAQSTSSFSIATTLAAGQAFTLDSFSLKEVVAVLQLNGETVDTGKAHISSFSSSQNLTSNMLRKNVYNNKSATGAITFTFTEVARVGDSAMFYCKALQNIKLEPYGTELFEGYVNSGGDSVTLTCDAVGKYVSIACQEAGIWSVMGLNGTLTDTN